MRLNGALNLSRLPKGLIRTNSKGEKIVYVNVNENYKPSPYGDTHNISVYDKENGRTVYLANLKPWEPEEKKEEKKTDEGGDLPF